MILKILKRNLMMSLVLFTAAQSINASGDPIIPDDEMDQWRLRSTPQYVDNFDAPPNFDPSIDQPDFLTEFQKHVPRTCQIMIGGVLTGFCAIGFVDIVMIFVRSVQFYFSEPGDQRFAYNITA